jgi:outer membrane protein assembly factor BamD
MSLSPIRPSRIALAATAVLLVAGCAAIVAGCGSSGGASSPQSSASVFAEARRLFEKNSLEDALHSLEVVKLQYPNTAQSDSAQWLLGEVNFRQEKFILAAYEYATLTRLYPSSPYIRHARFMIARCYSELSPTPGLDQESTRRAIDECQSFLETAGRGGGDSLTMLATSMLTELRTKLATKDLNDGTLYLRMGHPKSAIVYFDQVLERYYDTPLAEEALYQKALALNQVKRFSEAKREADRYLERFPGGAHSDEMRSLSTSIDTALRGGAGGK